MNCGITKIDVYSIAKLFDTGNAVHIALFALLSYLNGKNIDAIEQITVYFFFLKHPPPANEGIQFSRIHF